ncbi:uncharacterized protein CIMG_00448 [Coccidioides immitis RS]|uniref:Rhodopsin domain-containing protein n=1 Tax=Coccidioides immitis (strain RS) TaxID=246410 RepID=J3KH08_COCIM|nr:uncharacterized protein CIMG_00448 [Coccidioides immitis RS]EAS35094.3 hypothetical protein CIMG_00448 [Coccidioides immitis RS]
MAPRPLPSLPEGVLDPLTANNHKDRGGLIIVVSSISLSVALILLVIRTYIQIIRRTIKLDDILLLAATLIYCIQSSFVFLQVHHGWGKIHELLDSYPHGPMLKAAYVADILYIFTLYISKCSGSFFYLRISPGRILLFAVWTVVSIATIWTVSSLLLVSLRCDTDDPWIDITAKCSILLRRWEIIGGLDMFIELVTAATSVILVHDIQISRRQKLQIILALSSRIVVFVPAILRLHYLRQQFYSTDPTYDGTYTTICAQIQLGYLLVANTIPCLKPFIAAYEGSDAKPTFRGYSVSPRDSRIPSQYEESFSEMKSCGRKDHRLSRERPLSDHSAFRRHTRRGSGQSSLSMHTLKKSTGHQRQDTVTDPMEILPSPQDTTAPNAGEPESKLFPVAECPEPGPSKPEKSDERRYHEEPWGTAPVSIHTFESALQW